MADESDYTKMWSGVFTPPRVGDEAGGGIYILDDEASVGRNTQIYDDCTRVLYDEAHPRTHPGGQRYPGPYGAGRASDRIGPTLDEREKDLWRRSDREAGMHDAFTAGPAGGGGGPTPAETQRGLGARGGTVSSRPSGAERAAYARGDRTLGAPGPRGQVTSARGARPAIDAVGWDNRPLHFAPDTPNEYAHLSIDPEARGPPRFWSAPGYPGKMAQVDRFGAFGGGAGLSTRDACEVAKAVLFFVAVVLVAMWLMVSGAERRLSREMESVLREARAAAARPPGTAAPS